MTYSVSFDVLDCSGKFVRSNPKTGLSRKEVKVITAGYQIVLAMQIDAEPKAIFERSDKEEYVSFMTEIGGKETYIGGINVVKM